MHNISVPIGLIQSKFKRTLSKKIKTMFCTLQSFFLGNSVLAYLLCRRPHVFTAWVSSLVAQQLLQSGR